MVTELRLYLEEHRGERITELLDQIYGTEPGDLPPAVASQQARSLPQDDW